MTIVIAVAFILYSIPVYLITSILVIVSKFSKKKHDDNTNSIEETIDERSEWEEEQIKEYGDFREYRNK